MKHIADPVQRLLITSVSRTPFRIPVNSREGGCRRREGGRGASACKGRAIHEVCRKPDQVNRAASEDLRKTVLSPAMLDDRNPLCTRQEELINRMGKVI